jgi:hypothetical protein
MYWPYIIWALILIVIAIPLVQLSRRELKNTEDNDEQ